MIWHEKNREQIIVWHKITTHDVVNGWGGIHKHRKNLTKTERKRRRWRRKRNEWQSTIWGTFKKQITHTHVRLILFLLHYYRWVLFPVNDRYNSISKYFIKDVLLFCINLESEKNVFIGNTQRCREIWFFICSFWIIGLLTKHPFIEAKPLGFLQFWWQQFLVASFFFLFSISSIKL